MARPRVSFWLVLAAMLAAAAAAPAGEHVLIIGGGPAPDSNQLSLERNVHYFRRVLQKLRPGDAADADILFADGPHPGRDLQVVEPDSAPAINRLLARLIGPPANLDLTYRSHDLPPGHAPARLETIDRWFDDTAAALGPGDRVLIYFTGHGSRSAEKDAPHDTRMQLWGGQTLSMRQLVARLDRLPPEVPVVLVMVHCYGGGAAHVIFNGGDPAGGLADHARAGFFATVHDRPAAGCSPDVDEAEYREYSSYFWAALAGFDRLGEPLDKPDYDGDGRTTFDEAHAYAVIHAQTIDIPVKTSDAFVRHFSSTDADRRLDGATAAMMPPDASYSRVLAVAGPCERAALEAISGELGLTGEDRLAEARKLLPEIEAQRKRSSGERKSLQHRMMHSRRTLVEVLRSRWPELASPWHPRTPQIIADEGPAVLKLLRDHPAMGEFEKASEAFEASRQEDNRLERRWAKVRRLLHVAESAVLTHNLPLVADDTLQDRHARLVELERGSLD